MSRKARLPISLPKGVEAKFDGKVISVKGPKGSLTREIREEVHITVANGQIIVKLHEGKEESSNILGLYWALIFNMVKGVNEGFEKRLEMVGVGFRAAVQGKLLDLQIGLSHPTKIKIPEGVEVAVEKNTNIQIKGIDKRLVGQFAADVRGKKPPEPYKGKGIRYVDEYVRKKAGKAGKKG
jgi:large subunit ribosomal protein L6